jgi:amidase
MYDLEQIRRSAFVTHACAEVQTATDGPLAALTFAAKDLFDVEGFVTACGNPDRLREGLPASATALPVLVALMNGAKLVGKTHTDEIACGMFGMNPHFGTPINPKAPERAPGGSSSGSASAVAAGLCDFALGTDTGGSVRVPASFCGIYGLRTTHGRVSLAGVMAMAPSFDSFGWFARSPAIMRRVGEVYFGPIPRVAQPRVLLAQDAFSIPVQEIGSVLFKAASALSPMESVNLYEDGVSIWLDTFRPLQLYDLWSTLGAWARKPGRVLSQAVAERIDLAASVDTAAVAAAIPRRERLTTRLLDLLGDDGILVVPTAHDLPPLRDAPVSAQVEFREKTLALTCVASLCRLPQINLPAATVQDCPVGLSLIAGPRGDELLLSVAEQYAEQVQAAV